MRKDKKRQSEPVRNETDDEPQAQQGTPSDREQAPDESGNEAPAPEKELEALRQELQQAEDRLMRAKAENENYRKRTQRELANARTIAKAGTIEEFLTVFDHFQMAMDHAESSDDAEALQQGMKLIQTEFERAFQNLGVERIDAVGASFDPEQHHAVAEEESDGAPEGTVIRQWKPGYRLGDRLVRPASVVVSKGAVQEEPDETDEMPTAEEDESN